MSRPRGLYREFMVAKADPSQYSEFQLFLRLHNAHLSWAYATSTFPTVSIWEGIAVQGG